MDDRQTRTISWNCNGIIDGLQILCYVCETRKLYHYVDKPIQNTSIFKIVKIDNFHI